MKTTEELRLEITALYKRWQGGAIPVHTYIDECDNAINTYAEQVAKEHAIKFAEYNYQMPKYINFFPENILTTEEVYNKWINNNP